jgi:hypothetical protein
MLTHIQIFITNTLNTPTSNSSRPTTSNSTTNRFGSSRNYQIGKLPSLIACTTLTMDGNVNVSAHELGADIHVLQLLFQRRHDPMPTAHELCRHPMPTAHELQPRCSRPTPTILHILIEKFITPEIRDSPSPPQYAQGLASLHFLAHGPSECTCITACPWG